MIRKLLLLGLILVAAYFASRQETGKAPDAPSRSPSSLSVPPAANDNTEREDFDFYLLALSWSPSHCLRTGDTDRYQCGRNAGYGFIVHGLWPQHETGWPEFCSTRTDRVPAAVVDGMLDIMPSPSLVLHQWRKHGSCSGLSPKRYFELTRLAAGRIKIPSEYERPHTAQITQPSFIESRFKASNPGLKSSMIHVTCSRGTVHEVRICMDKNLHFRDCKNLEYKACTAPSIELPGVR